MLSVKFGVKYVLISIITRFTICHLRTKLKHIKGIFYVTFWYLSSVNDVIDNDVT